MSFPVLLVREHPCCPYLGKLFRFNTPGPNTSAGCSDSNPSTVEARKLEHGFRRISARIPYTLYFNLRA